MIRRIAAAMGVVVRACVVVSLLGGAVLLTGCGQKGPLFLPDRETIEVQPPAPQQPGTEPATEDATKKKEEPR